MELYFIALLPPKDLDDKITLLKKEFAQKYGAKRALRLPAHITLQIPFKMEVENEPKLISALESFVQDEKAFEIELSGFGHFSNKAVYVNVKTGQVVQDFFNRLQQVISSNLVLRDHEKTNSLHPHLTIATRDLHKKNFQQAWKDFKERKFEDSFVADSLSLFKHNHHTWDIFKQFKFRSALL